VLGAALPTPLARLARPQSFPDTLLVAGADRVTSMRKRVLTLGLGVLIAGGVATGVLVRRTTRSQPLACAQPSPGSQNDLTQEPPYTASGLTRWTDARGCLVRRDVIMTRTGAEHCGWQAVRDILMGNPLGRSHSHAPARIYVRDPAGVLRKPEIARAFQADVKLPSDARDTGYRQAGAQLWMQSTSDASLYLVRSNRVERWPRDTAPSGCK
jgi:hypothetical protein